MVDRPLLDWIRASLPAWRVEGSALTATWTFADFASAFAAASRVAFLAERADHHPDLLIGWGRLAVTLTTHSQLALTAKDVELALAIQGVLGSPQV